MSIATEITRLQNAKADLKTAIEGKGVTVSSSAKLDDYADLVDSISTGITPSGTLSVSQNGTYDVTNYASAVVNVSGASSPFALLNTIVVSENVRAVNLDFTNYQTYDFIFIHEDVELVNKDYIMFVKNGSAPSGNFYEESAIKHQGVFFIMGVSSPNDTKKNMTINTSGSDPAGNNGYITNLYCYAYNTNNRIKAGSVYRIYGGNYADM